MLAVVTKLTLSAGSTLPELLRQMSLWENNPLLRTSPSRAGRRKAWGH